MKLGTLALTGRSGRSYEFRLYVWRTVLKAVPAVYVVTERVIEPQREPTYNVVFVGNTEDVSGIFGGHVQQDCFDLHYANALGVLHEPDPAQREAIERDLVDALSPPCNVGEPT